MFSLVAEFHRAFGQIVATTPTLPAAPVRELRMRLLDEERDELADATKIQNVVEVADALADICYIACGTADVYGLGIGDDALPPSANLIDPPAYPFDGGAGRALAMVQNAVEIVRIGEKANNLEVIAPAIKLVVLACYAAADFYNIPLLEVFEEVHRSNMSKLGLDGKPILREDGKFLKGPKYFKADIKGILVKHGYAG